MGDEKTLKTDKKATVAGNNVAGKKRRRLWMVLPPLLVAGAVAIYFFAPWQSLPFLQGAWPSAGETKILSVPVAPVAPAAPVEKTLPMLPQETTNPMGPDPIGRLNGIEANIASLDARLAALESGALQGGEIKKLQSDLRALAAGLADLSAANGRAKTPGQMNPRLRAVEDLGEGLWEYGPFRARVAALLAVAGNDPAMMAALAPIATYADQGIATLPMLRLGFDGMAAAVLDAGRADGEGGWKERLFANLAGFLTIRRTGDVQGDSLEAVLARAEVALGAGDLARAVSLLETIHGPGAKAAHAWLVDARARLGATAAIGQLRRLAILPRQPILPMEKATDPAQ